MTFEDRAYAAEAEVERRRAEVEAWKRANASSSSVLIENGERIAALETERDALRAALEELHATSESFVNLARTRGEDLREEAAYRVRNAIAVARVALREKGGEGEG